MSKNQSTASQSSVGASSTQTSSTRATGEAKVNSEAKVVQVTRGELPVHCPTEAMGLWNSHPRVFIPLEENPVASCPYCGTQFELTE